MTRVTDGDKGHGVGGWTGPPGLGVIGDVTSSYRFSGPFVVRLMGVGIVVLGLLVLVLAALVGLLSLPGAVLTMGVVLALVAVVVLGLVARRRAVVVHFDDAGYRIRHVRGVGVRQAHWKQVEDVSAATVAGERCVLMRLKDGRTSTVPVGVLAARSEDFVADLQRHLNRGHGYRPVPGARG